MSLALRRASFVLFGALWASGVLWLVLHLAFAQPGAVGMVPSPWEPTALYAHGWIAAASLFLLGWISGAHVILRWRRPKRRLSGWSLAIVAALLALTGYALYYTSDPLHLAADWTHEVLGTVAIAFALVHWWGARAPGSQA